MAIDPFPFIPYARVMVADITSPRSSSPPPGSQRALVRDQHHNLARKIAQGVKIKLSDTQRLLTGDPAFKNLVAFYERTS